jgi:hypothetical protein
VIDREEAAATEDASVNVAPEPFSSQLEEWLGSGERRSIGRLVERFGSRSFAIIFVVLMAFPAIPLPTGGVTHVFEIVTMVLAIELIVGRTEVWIPKRWRGTELKGVTGPRFSAALLRWIRRLERFSRPRLAHLLERRVTNVVFGAIVFVLALTAFLAPPFSGLDTLPAIGVVALSLGVLLGDIVIAIVGIAIGALGITLVLSIGHAITKLL